MKAQETIRAEVKLRSRSPGQGTLWAPVDVVSPKYYDGLRERYTERAKHDTLALLKRELNVPYEQAWWCALRHPMVWESDLKCWVQAWSKDGLLNIGKLGARERVPKLGKSHELTWLGHPAARSS